MTSNPGLARLRAHPAAESVRAQVLRDQRRALELVAGLRRVPVFRGRVPADGKIVILVSKNPKHGTAAQRFSLYQTGMSIADYRAAVGNARLARADLRWDVRSGFIRIE
jgi:hypothetical protein